MVRSFLHQHELTIAASLMEARQHLAVQRFDAVLLDYDLDDGKGVALLPTLNALPSRPVVIASSSHAEGNSKLHEAGADLVCSKMDFREIDDRLKQASNPTSHI